MTPLQKERRALRQALQWADETPQPKTTVRSVVDLLAGFLQPADAIVLCKTCGAAEGEPCRPVLEKEKETLKPGFVHFGRRVSRFLLTAKARGGERERFEAEAVKMLRTYLAERRPS